MTDVLIVGEGPAGVSAALTLRNRGKEALIVSNDPHNSPLAKAEQVDNYPGLVSPTGRELVEAFEGQLDAMGVGRRRGQVISILPFGDSFMANVGQDVVEARAVILALGAMHAKPYPGEDEFLGRGVSYCATCDGMLYKGKDVCVVGDDEEAEREAAFLAGIGCRVTYLSRKPASVIGSLPEGADIAQVRARTFEVHGDDKVTALLADGVEYPCDAVFVLRQQISPTSLMPQLATAGAFIAVDKSMRTNIEGVFAAGDCTGKPLQVAKAVGEGQIAAFSASEWLDSKGNAPSATGES